jgi:60 kDa SS-A/Ro ribonucleoprotein
MAYKYAAHIAPNVPQTSPLPLSDQVKNSAGGYSFKVDCWTRLTRFLILGCEGGSYYASEKEMTFDNVRVVEECLKEDGETLVAVVTEISQSGRAPKNDPAIFALAIAAKKGDEGTRKQAWEAFPKVCRIGTHLFQFVETIKSLGGWGRETREGISRWYNEKSVEDLSYQMIKYQQRNGWSHRDILRLCHVKTKDPNRNSLYRWAVSGVDGLGPRTVARRMPGKSRLEIEKHYEGFNLGCLPEQVLAMEAAKKAPNAKELAKLIVDHSLPRECVPTHFLQDHEIWDALLQHMPIHAMIRNLGNMTRIGLLESESEATKNVISNLGNVQKLKKGRVHPIAILAALLTYKQGKGIRGGNTWTPILEIDQALEKAFYLSFGTIEPSNKKTMWALDVSGSMSGGTVAGVPGLTPRIASAALALVAANVEKDSLFVAFSTTLRELNIRPTMRLEQLISDVAMLPFGGTDCSLPMLAAKKNDIEIDTFVVLTDSETWAGRTHPSVALQAYRNAKGIDSKLVVVGMVSNGFTIADPNDPGMLDVIGFDTATPDLISTFSSGSF